MTRDEVKQLLVVMQSFYPNWKPEDKALVVNAWFALLKDRDNKAMQTALKWFVETNKSGFPPSAGELLDRYRRLTEGEDLQTAEAWSLVRKAISNSGYWSASEFEKLPEPVQKAVGSPDTLKGWALSDESELGFAEAQFAKNYKATIERYRERTQASADIQQIMSSRQEQIAQPKRELLPFEPDIWEEDDDIEPKRKGMMEAARIASERLAEMKKRFKGESTDGSSEGC